MIAAEKDDIADTRNLGGIADDRDGVVSWVGTSGFLKKEADVHNETLTWRPDAERKQSPTGK
jgi:hypothetical protein